MLIFLSARGLRVGSSSFLLEGRIDGACSSTRVLRSTPKVSLNSFAWKWNSQIHVVFLISKVSAPSLFLYWPIIFFQALKRATFSGNLKIPMPDFCLCFSYKTLPHWSVQQYIPELSLVILWGLFWEGFK